MRHYKKDSFFAGLPQRIVAMFLMMILTASVLSGCYFFPKEEEVLAPPIKEPDKVTYETIVVKKGTIEHKIRCSGVFVSISEKDYFYKDSGRLKEIYVKPGDKVKKGDLLAEIETDNLVNDIKLQEIALKKCQISYDSMKTRFDIEGGGNKSDLEIAALDLEANKIRLDSLLTALEKSKLTASIDGDVVEICQTKQGDYINAYDTIVRIADPKQLQLQYSDNRVSDFRLGMKVSIEISDKKYIGKVVMTPQDMPVDASEELKNSIRINVESLPLDVMIGDSAMFELTLEKQDNVIVLPKQVLNNFNNRNFINVLVNGIREERTVEIGIQTDTEIEIVKGLDVGDQVIIR